MARRDDPGTAQPDPARTADADRQARELFRFNDLGHPAIAALFDICVDQLFKSSR